MTIDNSFAGYLYAGNPYIRFGESEGSQTAMPRRGLLLCNMWKTISAVAVVASAVMPMAAKADAVRVYDADDYVQSGTDALLLQLDGIRNAGMSAAHQDSPAAWTDISGKNLTLAKTGSAGFSDSSWIADGSSYFTMSSDAVKDSLAAKAFTLEMVVSHTKPATSEYEYWLTIGNDGGHRELVVQLRRDNGQTNNPLVHAVEYREASWMNRSSITSDSGETKWGERQYIAIVCDENGATTYCNGAEDYIHRTAGGSVDPTSSAITIGAAWNQTFPILTGAEICAVRMTARALTEEERIYNYNVDRQRFFDEDAATIGRGNDIADVIVASNVEGVEGTEECGKWYVAEGTHTFTAPVSRILGTTVYNCSGYTVETWNGDGWGEAVAHNGERTFTASALEKVRLTWQWTQSATVRASSDYDIDDYVNDDSLIMHLDGIRNAGQSADHDSSATTWADLTGMHTLTRTGSAGFSEDAWVADGSSLFYGTSSTIKDALKKGEFTVEMVISHPTPTRTAATWYEYWLHCGDFSRSERQLLVDVRKDNDPAIGLKPLIGVVQYRENGWDTRSVIDANDKAKWDTRQSVAIVCNSDGATIYVDGVNKIGETTGGTLVPSIEKFEIGGLTSGNTIYSICEGSEICAVRMYAKPLTEDEIQQNQAVDAVRFHPNVTVVNGAVGKTGTVGESSVPSGTYNLDSGTWTLTAQKTIVDKHTYSPKLLVEEYDVAEGKWTAMTQKPVWAESYTVDKASLGDSRIRLTWTWETVPGLIISFH